MGLFNKFFAFRQQKRDERNALCRSAIEEIITTNCAIHDLIGHTPGYIYEYTYSNSLAEWKILNEKLPAMIRKMHKTADYRELQKQAQQFQTALNGLSSFISSHNREFLKNAIGDAYKCIGNVEGRPLDEQQMACIVKDAPNHLVVAGAGTGKTTTILGKVKYLLATDVCKAKEILVLSFTNAAASEMEARLVKETKLDIQVATFHKLGLSILQKVEGKAPLIYKEDYLRKFIRNQIDRCLQEPRYAGCLMLYLLFHRVNQKSEFEFDSQQSYQDYLTTNPPTTIKGEEVKSYGEMEIANFLSQYGIEYQYEAAYKLDTRTEEYAQYYPDFYLPQYDIYIEYYGVNKNGEVPAYFSGRDGKSAAEVYHESIVWKEKIHKENNTILIECYAHEKFDGVLLENLRKKLEKNNVRMEQVGVDQLFSQMDTGKKNVIDGLAELFQTVLSLSKGNRLSSKDLLNLCSLPAYAGQLVLVQLFTPVYDAYEKMLSDEGVIDFNDMINRAADYVAAGKYHHRFKCIIIDEYQDISKGQYNLLQAMRKDGFFSLFCVGDDWQSIYRFAGSDIGYILNFAQFWGDTETSKIETTYRFSQRLIDISSDFIMKNPNQLKKSIRASNDTEKYVIGEVKGYTDKLAIQFMVSKLEELPQNSTVYFIGRYRFDSDLLKADGHFRVNYNNVTEVLDVVFMSRPDLVMSFYTAHKSKGLQADYVFIINNRAMYMGFPSKIQNSPLVELLLERADAYPDAEERRLFYVAMTRARRRVYLVTTDNNLSSFAQELKGKYQNEMKKEAFICPLCGEPLVRRRGQYGDFYGCSNYRKAGCRYTRKINYSKQNRTTGGYYPT